MSEMSAATSQKLQKYHETLSKIQPSYGHDLGMIIVESENLGDLQAALPDPNNVSTYELDQETDITGTIKEFLGDLQNKRTVLLQLHEFLDPKIYNQLHLISQSGRADFFLPNDSITFDVPKESVLILVSTNEELGKLNYHNILDIVGPVLRLED